MHETYSDVLLKYANVATQTGEPIIRPLWWIAPDDDVALTCEDEFLVGDEFLVAPVMVAGARARDIYFPDGRWRDQFKDINKTIEGPKWEINVYVALDELAFYRKV
jgi:alpha-glucosidase (family GH31 glycosyl hydrolase)